MLQPNIMNWPLRKKMILFVLLFKSFVLLFNYQQPFLIFEQAD